MNPTIHPTFVPADVPDKPLAFCRNVLGFGVHHDVRYGGRWITVERVQSSGADVVQELVDQPYGIRDCAFRDPAGDLVRVNQLP